jgi:hypothetical protein
VWGGDRRMRAENESNIDLNDKYKELILLMG